MCEHHFIEVHGTKLDYEKNDNGRIETVVRRKVCWKCYKTKTEIELEQQLLAANARVAELEQENSKLASAAIEQPPYKNDLLAQNKRIQTAINQYVIGNIELLDAMKAALEEKS
mgnify:CR=1 FL=1